MHNTLTPKEREQGYQLLFDGETLNGWDCTANPEGWGVEDGCIVCYVKRGRFLYTHERFDHFELRIEFKTEPGVNSGVLVRVSDLSDLIHNALEMQILDTAGEPVLTSHSCGALYDLQVPSAQAAKPAGQWNEAVITCQGSRIGIELNGALVVTADLAQWSEVGRNPDGTANKYKKAIGSLPQSGRICLQDHQGKVWFRNVKLRPLPL